MGDAFIKLMLAFFILLILTGMYLLISGYFGISNSEKGSNKFTHEKNKVRVGIIISTIIIALVIVVLAFTLYMIVY